MGRLEELDRLYGTKTGAGPLDDLLGQRLDQVLDAGVALVPVAPRLLEILGDRRGSDPERRCDLSAAESLARHPLCERRPYHRDEAFFAFHRRVSCRRDQHSPTRVCISLLIT